MTLSSPAPSPSSLTLTVIPDSPTHIDAYQVTNLRFRIATFWPGSQNSLADATKINRGRLSQYATGTVRIAPHHILTLARFLECNPSDLLGVRTVPHITPVITLASDRDK